MNSLKSFYTALTESDFLDGVSVMFGEEMLSSKAEHLPRLVIVPTDGNYLPSVGYANQPLPQSRRILSGVKQTLELHLWAISALPNPNPIDNADAVEDLRDQVLQALGAQRWTGFYWKPVSQRWVTANGAQSRYGRFLVVFVEMEFNVVDYAPSEAEVTEIQVTPLIIPQVE